MAITKMEKMMCRGCNKRKDGQNEIVCSVCDDAFHAKCAGMTISAVQCVKQLAFFNWFCNSCGEKYAECAANSYREDQISSLIDAPASSQLQSDSLTELKELVLDCRTKIEALTPKSGDVDSDFSLVTRKRKRRRQNLIIAGNPVVNRGKNLIIAGVPEADPAMPVSAQSAHDMKFVAGLCQTLEIDTDFAAKVVRLKKGDPTARHYALMRVEFSNPDIRKALLRNSMHLIKSALYKSVYVRPDLTPAELARHKLLIAELKQRRGAGENVIICSRSNKVVLRSMASA